jgi:hypothetical protein
MSTWAPAVNRHVTYLGANRKPRPATITNVDSPTVLDLRVGHHVDNGAGADEVYLNVPLETGTPFSSETNVWTRLGR